MSAQQGFRKKFTDASLARAGTQPRISVSCIEACLCRDLAEALWLCSRGGTLSTSPSLHCSPFNRSSLRAALSVGDQKDCLDAKQTQLEDQVFIVMTGKASYPVHGDHESCVEFQLLLQERYFQSKLAIARQLRKLLGTLQESFWYRIFLLKSKGPFLPGLSL